MSVDDLSRALKAAGITQEGGKGILNENPSNLAPCGDSIVGTSKDQKVKKRKKNEGRKRVMKRKSRGMLHSLRAICKENEQFKSEINVMLQELQPVQDDIKELNKTITAQEYNLETLCQKPFVQHLMMGSNELEVAAQCAVSSLNPDWDDRMTSEAKQSSDGITELNHRNMVLGMKIELLCKMIINEEPKEQE